MTENEAKEWIEYLGNKPLPYDRNPISRKLACDMAIQALEEVQAYRTIGTVERLLQLQHDYWYLNEMCKEYSAIGTVEEIEKSMRNVSVLLAEHELLKLYQSIGTIDEFKTLKEKSVAKKPIRDKEFSSLFECPTCGRRQKIMYELYHCKECGQKLDWSE